MNDCPELSFMPQLGQAVLAQGIPLNGTFELTRRCNFRCRMCYIRLEESQIPVIGNELSPESWLEIARQARDLGMLHLTLSGGEVFTYPFFRELYEELCDLGLLITIQTNGYAIDEKVMRWLGKRQPFQVRLSLYGASNDTYFRLCGVRNGFDRVNNAIDLINQAGIPLSAVTTLTVDNVQELPLMQNYAKDKGFPLGNTSLLMPAIRGSVSESQVCSLDIPGAIRASSKNIQPRQDRPMLWDCGSYRNGFYVTFDGRLQLCTFLSEPNLPAFTFKDSWQKLLACLKEYQEPKQCKDCDYKSYCPCCPGRLAAWTLPDGTIDPRFCEIARARSGN